MMTASAALQRLRARNLSFVSSTGHEARGANEGTYAVILGCPDPRFAPEIVFNTGLDELFVVRGGGSIATPAQFESIALAAGVILVGGVLFMVNAELASESDS